MALLNLGVQSLNNLYEYVSYDSFAAIAGNTYTIRIRFLNTQPELLYSYFRMEFRHGSPEPGNFTQVYPEKIYFTNLTQTLDFRFTPNIPISGDVTPRLVRLPTYSQPSSLSDVDIRLFVDPDVFY